MKFKLFLLCLLFTSCATQVNKNHNIKTYSSIGFAYIYDEIDYTNKITGKKFNNEKLQLGSSILKPGTIVRITNVENKQFIILKISKKTKYPDFYKILITKALANKIKLNPDTPFVEIEEIKKNKTFIASESETFKEEQKIHNTAPVTNVKVDNISQHKIKKKRKVKYSIIIASFYSKDSAIILKDKIFKELNYKDVKKLSIKKKEKNNYHLTSGRYNTVNSLKKDYIELKKYGFEELEVLIHE